MERDLRKAWTDGMGKFVEAWGDAQACAAKGYELAIEERRKCLVLERRVAELEGALEAALSAKASDE